MTEELKCNDVKHCKTCKHYVEIIEDVDFMCIQMGDRCRRLQTRKCDIITPGSYIYIGKLLKCRVERGIEFSSLDYIFNENDKCGKEGKYWEKI